jgi:hypothetical protein
MNKFFLATTLACALASLSAGCTSRDEVLAVPRAPAGMPGVVSGLTVPTECPIYTPTGRDTDTPEAPYTSPMLFGCGLDSAGQRYGLVTGDTGGLAVLNGDREIGVFYAFDSSIAGTAPTLAQLGLDGPNPAIEAFAAPTNVYSPTDCCAEDHPSAKIPVRIVAFGPEGILMSLGHFTNTPTQVAIGLTWSGVFPSADLSYMERFYVAGIP